MSENTAGQPMYEIPICSCGKQNSAGMCEHVRPVQLQQPVPSGTQDEREREIRSFELTDYLEMPNAYSVMMEHRDHLLSLLDAERKRVQVLQDNPMHFLIQGGPVVMASDYDRLKERVAELEEALRFYKEDSTHAS